MGVYVELPPRSMLRAANGGRTGRLASCRNAHGPEIRRIRLMPTLADTREELRVAIVGAGLMGRWHAQYATASGAEIAAIVDPDPAARATLGKKYGTAAQFADLEACFGADGVEV